MKPQLKTVSKIYHLWVTQESNIEQYIIQYVKAHKIKDMSTLLLVFFFHKDIS